MYGEFFFLFMYIYFLTPFYPLMLTKRSSAALWMWNTSSLNRQRQVELCRASFHRDNAAASLFSAAWHRIKPTGRAHTGSTPLRKQAPIEAQMLSTALTNNPLLHGVQGQVFTRHLKADSFEIKHYIWNLKNPWWTQSL